MTESKQPQALLTGAERELQIYALGLSGGKPSVPVPLDLLDQKAKEILTPRAYDYVAGGGGGGETLAAQPGAVYRGRLWARVPRDRSQRHPSAGPRVAWGPRAGRLG